MGNLSVFFSDKYDLINDDNNSLNLGWLLDFRNSVGDKSQVYSINGTSATYKQDNALTREISLVANLGYEKKITDNGCLLYTSPSPRDLSTSRMPSSA